MIADSHCHLDYPHLFDQLTDVVKRAENNQVKYFLTICTTLESFEKIKLIIFYKNFLVYFYILQLLCFFLLSLSELAYHFQLKSFH